MEKNQIHILPGMPNDSNRDYLPEEIVGSDMVVNENGNNSQVYPERLKEYREKLADDLEDIWYEYVPESYHPDQKTPLVVSCHGGLMTGWGQCIYTSWSYVADREGVIVVFPNAHKNRLWQIEFDPRKKGELSEPIPGLPQIELKDGPVKDYHDVRFLLALIKKMKQKYNIDSGKIYIQGMSMGNAMASQMVRHFGFLFAGAAGSGCPTDTGILFDDAGKVRNEGGPLDIMVSRLEHDKVPPYYSDSGKKTLMENYRYWCIVNKCDNLPKIHIQGDYNFVFFNGEIARFQIMDVKNRDHGQTFDDAEYMWGYNFSGVRRSEDGTLLHTECSMDRSGDRVSLAVADGCEMAWVNHKLVLIGKNAFTWHKLKYHGLNGREIVRGEYLYAPVLFCASVFGADCVEEENGRVAIMVLSNGVRLQFAQGSIGCVVGNHVESMLCEAVYREKTLFLPIRWIAERFYNMHCSECEGVLYMTDHPAKLSTYTSWILKDLMGGDQNGIK